MSTHSGKSLARIQYLFGRRKPSFHWSRASKSSGCMYNGAVESLILTNRFAARGFNLCTPNELVLQPKTEDEIWPLSNMRMPLPIAKSFRYGFRFTLFLFILFIFISFIRKTTFYFFSFKTYIFT